MSVVTGTVTQVKDIMEGSSTRGPWKKRSFAIDGEWYSGFLNDNDLGTVVEGLQGGEQVEVNFTVNGKFKNFNDVVVLKEATVPSTVQGTTAEVKKENFQERMNFIGARNTAIRLIDVALSNDLISLPTKKEDKLQAFEALIDQYANDLADASWNYEYNDNKGDIDGQEDTGYAE